MHPVVAVNSDTETDKEWTVILEKKNFKIQF